MVGREVVLNTEQIEAILPHRYPFLLVDRVVQLTPGPDPTRRLGRKAVCIKNVTATEPHFTGHFPHWKVMPGVLQIEALAQASALAAVLETDRNFDVVIAAISEARFRKPVVPGDTLELHAEIIKEKGVVFVAQTTAYVDGEKVVEANLTARAFPNGIAEGK